MEHLIGTQGGRRIKDRSCLASYPSSRSVSPTPSLSDIPSSASSSSANSLDSGGYFQSPNMLHNLSSSQRHHHLRFPNRQSGRNLVNELDDGDKAFRRRLKRIIKLSNPTTV